MAFKSFIVLAPGLNLTNIFCKMNSLLRKLDQFIQANFFHFFKVAKLTKRVWRFIKKYKIDSMIHSNIRSSIRLGWKGLPGANTVAYYKNS